MITQFFGNYLLSQQLVSPEHLSEVFQTIKNTRPQLGELAVNAGLITSAQAEKAHAMQQRTDKRIGEVMAEMGYLTEEQTAELLRSQPAGYLVLGQALVDNGYMTASQLERAAADYKKENGITDEDIRDENSADIRLVRNFYNFGTANSISEYITGYVSLLFKNLIRFIGGDFTPMDAHALMGALSDCAAQRMDGGLSAVTVIDADAAAIIEFASRFAKEQLTDEDEYTHSCVCDFINLHNCLFADSMSNRLGIKLRTGRQQFCSSIDLSELANACVIPARFSFGVVNFIIAM